MDKEEKESIFNILCKQYEDTLNGDKLTFTNAIDHTIKLKPNTQPIHKRPYYMLPFSQQAEIDRQIKQMENECIIQSLLSPCSIRFCYQ